MSTLSIENVSVARGPRNVVHDVTIEVPPNEVTTILGPNGAGKSSLALACAGLARVTKGWVNLDGKNLANGRPDRIRAAGISVVPEGRRLLPNLTVQENLMVATYSLGRHAAADGLAYTLSLFPELEKRWHVQGRSRRARPAWPPTSWRSRRLRVPPVWVRAVHPHKQIQSAGFGGLSLLGGERTSQPRRTTLDRGARLP